MAIVTRFEQLSCHENNPVVRKRIRQPKRKSFFYYKMQHVTNAITVNLGINCRQSCLISSKMSEIHYDYETRCYVSFIQ